MLKEFRVLKVVRGLKEFKEKLLQQGLKVLKGLKEFRVLKEFKVLLVQLLALPFKKRVLL